MNATLNAGTFVWIPGSSITARYEGRRAISSDAFASRWILVIVFRTADLVALALAGLVVKELRPNAFIGLSTFANAVGIAKPALRIAASAVANALTSAGLTVIEGNSKISAFVAASLVLLN